MTDVRNVVLVHGGFVDGSGWQGVYDLLTADGFNVSVVQNQTLSLESDVETARNVLDLEDGPAILVGHSYGGVVITEAGHHERVAGLVYITAFAPDSGESVTTLIADPPPGAPVPPILPPQDGFLFGRDGRPDDPAPGATGNGRASRVQSRRRGGQPLDLHLAAAGQRRTDRAGRPAGPPGRPAPRSRQSGAIHGLAGLPARTPRVDPRLG
jgi:pimeloyl-ACP methyl ester carboxylesterase